MRALQSSFDLVDVQHFNSHQCIWIIQQNLIEIFHVNAEQLSSEILYYLDDYCALAN